MSGSRCPEASGSFRPASSLVQSRAHNTHAVTVKAVGDGLVLVAEKTYGIFLGVCHAAKGGVAHG
eukprot:6409834-Prymnesium_polylepis.1